MLTILIFIAVLAVLVLSHELGHFFVARKCGIKVEEFGFGFPPRLVGVRRVVRVDGKKSWHIVWGRRAVEHEVTESVKEPGTVYSINWLPLGGFVKIKGEDGDRPNDPDSFGQKPMWAKMSVVAAGVVMNVLLAAALLSFAFTRGVPQLGSAAPAFAPRQVQIMEVLPGRPAALAGLKTGDILRTVGDLSELRVQSIQDYVGTHREQAIVVTVERNGARINFQITPMVYADSGRAGFGIAITEVALVRLGVGASIIEGARTTGIYTVEIFKGFGQLMAGLFRGTSVGTEVAGPVGVAVMTGEAARLGFSYLLQFTALLSLNLAVLNILPIPALDGGRLLFLIIAAIRRRPLAQRTEQVIHSVGFALLLLLVLAVTVKDLTALWLSFNS